MVPHKNPNLDILAHFFTCFSPVCNFNIIIHHFWTPMYVSCHISSYYALNIIFLPFLSPNHESNPILFLQASTLYSGRGSTSWVLVWCSILTKENQGHIHVVGSSLLSVWCLRGLPMLSWRKPWLRGGGILPTPSTLLAWRWLSLLITSTAWLAYGLMGSRLV